jgi:signal peptidase I
VVLAGVLVRLLWWKAYKVPSGAMSPTLQIGDHILVRMAMHDPPHVLPFTHVAVEELLGMRELHRGDVVVFLAPARASPDGQRRMFVKRVVAFAGETVEVRNNQLYVDGRAHDEPHAVFRSRPPDGAAPVPAGIPPCGSLHGGMATSCAPYLVPPGHVFVMGDNRDQSYDSRYWGAVPAADVQGVVRWVYWSWDSGGVRGERIGLRVE